MKPALLAVLLAVATSVLAEDSKPVLVSAGKVIVQPDLKQPLAGDWSVRHGTWDVKDGEMVVAELPENKHAAVLWHQVPLQSAVVECEFQFDGGKTFILGCDSSSKHVGRLTITAKSAKIAEDSSEVKGKNPGKTLAETPLDLKPGQWYPVRFEWTGDKMAARIAGKEIHGQDASLSTAKARWWFAVSGAKIHLRNVKLAEGK